MNQERFQLGQVAEIIDTSPQTIKTWVARGVIVSSVDGEAGIEGGREEGSRRSFSIHAVMQMSVAKALISFGFRDTERAFDAAARFAHVGHGPSGWVGEPMDARKQRLPGMPYHYSLGHTLLLITEDTARVVLEGDIKTWIDGKPVGMITDLSVIFDQVCGRLMAITGDKRWHPSAILDAAYPADVAQAI